MIRFFTFEKYHNKKNVGSSKIRVHNLIKYWPEAELYKYGEKPDVMIFQKVYVQPDFEWPQTLDCIKILDICDPDWLEEMPIKQTIDAMDAVTVPTQALKDFLSQMTDKPVRIIKDRFDLSEFPTKPKAHLGQAKNVVWFGYSHNAKKLKGAIHAIIELDLKLTVISDKDPSVLAWAEAMKMKPEKYKFIQFKPEEINYELTKHDIAILPDGVEPHDRFKSENKEIIANLCGLPVVKTRDELEAMLDPKNRNQEIKQKHKFAIDNYNCIISVREMQKLIKSIASEKHGKA